MGPQGSAASKNEQVSDRLAAEIEEATGGDIVVGHRLGEGRTGLVYVADQLSLDRKVAVKILLPRHLRDSKAVVRFKREARAMAGCPHPGIVSVFNVGETKSGIPFFVMEYIEGEALDARLRRKVKLTLPEAVRITAALADALSYAHQRGLIHRDVKPANVLIEKRTGRILLTDFGLAKLISGKGGAITITGQGQIIGTPPYLSPEQAESGTVDSRSDQYSLAAMAYEMISGSRPFPGPDPQDYVRQHAEDTPPCLLRVEPSLPTEVSRVIDRALMKEPGARFASAEAFGEALRSAASSAGLDISGRVAPWRGHELRMVQATAIYAGVSWGLLEATSWIIETFGLPMQLRQPALWIVVAAFPVVLGLTWYVSKSRATAPQRTEAAS